MEIRSVCSQTTDSQLLMSSETDIDEVVQIHNVFINVSKGQAASHEDLQKSFKTTDIDVILQEVESVRSLKVPANSQILKKGELQVGEKERTHQIDNLRSEIATIVAEKCVNPQTKRPYTVTMIEKALADIHFSVNTNKSAKSQALDTIKILQEKSDLPIARAEMRIRVAMPLKDAKTSKDKVKALMSKIEDEDTTDEWEVTATISPGNFKVISDLLQSETKGRGVLEMLSLRETQEGEERF